MTADLGLRRRAVSELAANWEEKEATTKMGKRVKPAPVATADDVAKVPTAAKSSLQGLTPDRFGTRRYGVGCIVTAILVVVTVFAAGLFAGVVSTVTVMATHDYPWLDAQLGRLVQRLGHELSIQVGPPPSLQPPPKQQVTSCTADQPLVERRQNVLDDETFARVQACLTDHPMTTENELNPEGFNGTRGFVIGFSTLGVEQFRQETKFNCGDFNPLVPFFEAARHPETNGFVMNVLVCDQPTTKDTLSVGEHVDDTLSHRKVSFSAVTKMKLTEKRMTQLFLTLLLRLTVRTIFRFSPV